MAVRRVQLRRGTTAQNDAFTGVEGEITIDTETKSIRVHDAAQAGGFDLMRADMSNDSFAAGNITIAEGVGANTLTIGAGTTTVSIPGNLTVAGNVTQENTLTVASKLITINSDGNNAVLSNDSIGIIYERTKDGNPGAVQDSAFIIWRENGDYFVLGTASVDENTSSDFTQEGDFAYADLYLGNVYAQNSVDVNDNDITNVGQISLDSITFADAGTVITINLEDALNDKALTVKDAGNSEYLTINTNAESTTLGVPSKEIILRGNLTTLGTNANPGVDHTIQVESTNAVAGQDLTIEAGTTSLAGGENGGDLILSTGGGTGAGTASMQFKTLVANGLTPAERMRIHTDGNVGIGDSAPGTLLQLSGADAYLTLKNTTAENTDGGAETKIIFEDHGNNALGQIEVSHQGLLNDEFGQMIFSTNNDAGLQTALTIDKDQKATFAGVVSVATSLDMTTGAINNVTDIDLDKITDRENNGIEIELTNNIADALIVREGGAGEEYINIATTDAGPTLTLAQATTLSSTLKVEGGQATIEGGEGNPAILYLNADQSDDGGDNWRVQATDHVTRTLTFSGENIAGDAYVDVLTLTGADTSASSSATVKGTLLVEGEIHSNTDLVFRVDADQATSAGNNSFSFKNGGDSEVASLTEAGVLTVTGLANLNGGIAVDTNMFTVDGGGSGNTATKGTLTVSGNTVIGVATEGSPNLSVVNNDGTTTFSVTGATGNTTIVGTTDITGITTLDDTLKIKSAPTSSNALTINSDRTTAAKGAANTDVNVIFVEGGDNGTDAYLKWDDSEDSFVISGGKLHSETQFSVGGTITTAPNFKAVPSTGAVTMVGTGADLTLRNNIDQNGAGEAETQIQFQDHDEKNLATIQASHEGVANDSKGQLLFYTNTGGQANEGTLALTLSSAQLATFAGNLTVSGNTITFGNSATIVNGAANTLTITEDNIKFAGITHITAGVNENAILYMSADNSTEDADDWRLQATDGNLFSIASFISGAYQDFFSIVGNNNTLLSTTTVEGKLVVKGASISGITDGDLAIASDGDLIFHIDTDSDEASIFSFKVNGAVGAGTEVAQIDESGNLQIDGDLTLGGSTIKSNDGTATIELATNGTNTTIEKVLTVKGNGTGASSVVLGVDDGNASVLGVASRSGNNTAGSVLKIQGGASTGSAAGGSIEFYTTAAGAAGDVVNAQVKALSIASDKSATFEGAVTIKGNLDIQNTGTLTTIDTTNLSVTDKVIELASNADQAVTNANLDTGIVFTRGSDVNPAVFFWDEGDDKFVLATKSGASTSTTDFSNTDTTGVVVEAQLDVGTLNADVITIDDDDATSLVIKEGGNAYLTFNTLNADAGSGNEQVEFGKIFTAITGSKIGNVTYSNNEIQGAAASDLSIKSTQDIIFNIDSDNNGANKFSFQHNVGTEIASITSAGALSIGSIEASSTTLLNDTLTVRTNNVSAFLVEKTGGGGVGADILKVDTNSATPVVEVGSSAVLKTNKIQATSDSDNSFQIYLKDNTATGLMVSNVSADVEYLSISTTNASPLITLIQPTKASAVLTLDDSLKVNKAGSDTGIVFNADRAGGENINNQTYDALLLHVENGGSDATDGFIKWDDSESSFKIEGGKLFSATEFSVGTEAANVLSKNFTVTTAGAVTAVGGFTDTTTASSFATGTTVGSITLSNNDITTTGALTVKSATDMKFHIDSDDDGANSFSFVHGAGAGTEVVNINESGDVKIYGNIVGDADEAKTIFAATTTEGNLITLGGGGTVKTAGKLRVTGNEIEDGGNASAIVFDGSQNTNFNGNVSIDTTKTLTLNNGVANADADVDARIIVDRGTNTDAELRWDEGEDRWLIDNGDGTGRQILHDDDVLFTIDGDGDADTTTITKGGAQTILFKGSTDIDNAGIEFHIDTNSVVAKFETSVKMPGDLTLVAGTATGSLTAHNITAENQLLVENGLTVSGGDLTVSAGDLKVQGNLIYDASTVTLTVAGDITVTKAYHKVELNNTGNATENLNTITGGITGMVIVLQANHTDRSVVVKNTNFKLKDNTDFTLDSTEDTISLIYNGNHWCELSRSSNNAV